MTNGNKILFIVVLYEQVYETTNVYRSLLYNVDTADIYIWDNSRNCKLNQHLSQKYKYIYSEINKGVSAAYNSGAKYASLKGFKWIVLLDQDTYFDKNFQCVLNHSIENNPTINLFCPVHCLEDGTILSPSKFFLKFTRKYKSIPAPVITIRENAVINSGLVVRLSLFNHVGGFNEKVFLDYSDFQFLERVSRICSDMYCMNTFCVQEFSNNETDSNKLLNRYVLFCRSLKFIEHPNVWHRIQINLVVIKRAISLIFRLKSLMPINIYFYNYMR